MSYFNCHCTAAAVNLSQWPDCCKSLNLACASHITSYSFKTNVTFIFLGLFKAGRAGRCRRMQVCIRLFKTIRQWQKKKRRARDSGKNQADKYGQNRRIRNSKKRLSSSSDTQGSKLLLCIKYNECLF